MFVARRRMCRPVQFPAKRPDVAGTPLAPWLKGLQWGAPAGGTVLRCIECVTEPITPGHFCECCGRKLSLEERRGLEVPAASVAPPPAEPASYQFAPVELAPVLPEPVAPAPATVVAPVPPPAVPVGPVAAVAPVASAAPEASATRCESCGGPSDDGALCSACQQVFHAFLSKTPQSSAAASTPATPLARSSSAL